jgi:sodium/proline symporter
MQNLTVLISFSLYSLVIIALGVYSAKFARRSNEDYYLAGRRLGPWVTSLSASASSESGWVMMGLVAEAFRDGLATFWVVPGCLLGYVCNWFFIARRLREKSRELGALTVPDFFSRFFNERLPILRISAVIIILVSMVCYVAAQFDAAGTAFSAAFDLQFRLGVLIGAGIVLAYTVLGGFRAVSWTDFLQALLMITALVILPILLVSNIGGWDVLVARLAEAPEVTVNGETYGHFGRELVDAFAGTRGFFAVIGFLLGFLGIGLGYPGQPHAVIRFMAAKDERALKRGSIIAMVWGLFVFSGAVMIGLSGRVLFDVSVIGNAERILPIAAIDYLPGALAGLMIAAILAALCSTADSQLVVAASSVANDIVARRSSSKEERLAVVNRVTVLIIGLLAMGLALSGKKDIFNFVLRYAWAFLGASFGPLMILTLFWKRLTWHGAVAGMLTGFVTTFVWKNIPVLDDALYNLVAAFFLALVTAMVVSVATSGREVTRRQGSGG